MLSKKRTIFLSLFCRLWMCSKSSGNTESHWFPNFNFTGCQCNFVNIITDHGYQAVVICSDTWILLSPEETAWTGTFCSLSSGNKSKKNTYGSVIKSIWSSLVPMTLSKLDCPSCRFYTESSIHRTINQKTISALRAQHEKQFHWEQKPLVRSQPSKSTTYELWTKKP